MNFNTMSNHAIAAEIGQRISQLRLKKNLSQQQVADEIGMSRMGYGKLEKGTGKFENMIATLRVLDRLDLIEHFIPQTPFSPMEQLKLKGKQRQRATAIKAVEKNSKQDNELDW
jgi:transcriptional regulator with XRE-family HTH domain